LKSDQSGELTKRAKDKFIKDVKEELKFGTAGLPVPPAFPCGPDVPPFEFADLFPLEDEAKFPDFHENILGKDGLYAKFAQMLDLPGGYKFLPICCPISLAVNLGLKLPHIKFPFISVLIPNLPGLAIKLNVKLPKLPGLLLNLPKPEFPKLPKFNFDLRFIELISLTLPKIPDFVFSLVLKIPNFALKIPNLPDLFKLICKLAFDAKLFSVTGPESLTEIVALKVLTHRIVEMAFIAAIGTSLGSAPAGLTGGIGKKQGYEPPPQPGEPDDSIIRDKIIKFAQDCIDESLNGNGHAWSDGDDLYIQKLLPTESADPKNKNDPAFDPRAIGVAAAKFKCSVQSSCGMFLRVALAAGGAHGNIAKNGQKQLSRYKNPDPKIVIYYDFFQDEYRVGTGLSGIVEAAKQREEEIPGTIIVNGATNPVKDDLPPMKRGDVIIVYKPGANGKEHGILVGEDYPGNGSLNLTTYEGGQTDPGNTKPPAAPGGAPTAIRKNTYQDGANITKGTPWNEQPYGIYRESGTGHILMGGRKVLWIFDGEKLCGGSPDDPVGKKAKEPDPTQEPRTIKENLADNNDPQDPDQFLPVPA